jgi:ribosomal protein L32E
MGRGYNRILERAKSSIVILAHQDVYLPSGWEELLAARIADVETIDPDWGVLSAYGIGLDDVGWGPVWSSSLGSIVGRVSHKPVCIQSADELLLVVRCERGLTFDDGMPSFHFHGVDIVQTALQAGLGAWSISLPLVHNDRFHPALGAEYDRCYHYIRRKWRQTLPLKSPTIRISWHGLHLLRAKWRNRRSLGFRKDMATQIDTDPRIYAAHCGWERSTFSAF